MKKVSDIKPRIADGNIVNILPARGGEDGGRGHFNGAVRGLGLWRAGLAGSFRQLPDGVDGADGQAT